MKRIQIIYCLFLSELLLVSHFAIAQTNDSIFKVDVRYSTGQWDNRLSLIKSSEEFISVTKETGYFKITKHYSVEKLIGQHKSIQTDTTRYFSSYELIKKERIEALVNSLDLDRNNANEEQAKNWVGSITDKQIIEVARQFKLDWMFKNKYSTKNERNILFKNIRALKLFSEFYERCSPPNYKVNADFMFANDIIGFTIVTYTTKDTTQYIAHTVNLLQQPFCRVLDSKSKNINCVINLDINKLLVEILPSGSTIKQILETSLSTSFIRWALDDGDMWKY